MNDEGRGLLAHAADGSGAMAFQERVHIQVRVWIVEKAIIAFEIMAVATGGLRIRAAGLGRLVADNLDQPACQSFITQLTISKFVLCQFVTPIFKGAFGEFHNIAFVYQCNRR